MELTTLLDEMTEGTWISDLHLVAGQPPVFRKEGTLIRREGAVLDAETLEKLIAPHLSEALRVRLLHEGRDVTAAVRHGGQAFRMHVFRERGNLCAALRIRPRNVPTLDELGFEGAHLELLKDLTKRMRGLVIVTGPTGSGKSTTIASMIEEINRTRAERILTVEDPIEYEFTSKESLITQCEMDTDFPDFPRALRGAFFTDPDVILVGALNTLESLQLSLSLAETGHLVFAPLGQPSASEALERLVASFPESNRREVRRQLSNNLQAVIAQQLVPRFEKPGRVALHEILMATPAVRQAIRDGASDFAAEIEAGREIGMQTMDDALVKAVEAGEIGRELALGRLSDPSRLATAPSPPSS